VAVKVLIGKEDINRGQLELPERVLRELQAEAAVMSHMRHPNIVQFMGLVAVPPALITEYCSRGSLYDCLAAAREQPVAAAQLTWHRRLAMAVDAGAGLLYLHRRNIIHRDVKSPNLLVDKDWNVKVADFNLSKLLEGARPEGSLTSAAATNPIWLAPEILEGGRATAASDVYSFGLVSGRCKQTAPQLLGLHN
jgi:serine/threonine protein kinase